MHKKELVEKLEKLWDDARRGKRTSISEYHEYLIAYLKRLAIPADLKYDHWDIVPHLPQIVVDALEDLRAGTDEFSVKQRQSFGSDGVVNVIDLGAESSLVQAGVFVDLVYLLRDAVEPARAEHVRAEFERYCRAQSMVLQVAFDKFLRMVFRRGMYDMIAASKLRGMTGTFGETEFRTYSLAGRLMFTFARRIDKRKPSFFKKGEDLYRNEDTFTFVGEDDDPLCLSAGLQSVDTSLRTCLDMIDEVIRLWPNEKAAQAALFVGDEGLRMG